MKNSDIDKFVREALDGKLGPDMIMEQKRCRGRYGWQEITTPDSHCWVLTHPKVHNIEYPLFARSKGNLVALFKANDVDDSVFTSHEITADGLALTVKKLMPEWLKSVVKLGEHVKLLQSKADLLADVANACGLSYKGKDSHWINFQTYRGQIQLTSQTPSSVTINLRIGNISPEDATSFVLFTKPFLTATFNAEMDAEKGEEE